MPATRATINGPPQAAVAVSPNVSTRRDYATIQALRAVAALGVVAFHALAGWQIWIDPTAPRWANGAAGVDIFFVISGFVMLVSSGHLAARPDGWREFLRRRLIRIVPLYWLITSAKVLGNVLFPAQSVHVHSAGAYHIVASYLFIPSRDAAGEIVPVVAVGWTLSYEMLFYLLFAAALFWRRGVLTVVLPVLGFLALLSPLRTAQWPAFTEFANPLGLEFVAGVGLAMVVLGGHALNRTLCWIALLLGVAAIAVMPEFGRNLRPLGWGLPAFAIVAAAAMLEDRLAGKLPRWLLFLGDASYAIYLTHFIAIHFLVSRGLWLARHGLHGLVCEAAMVFLCLAGSCVVGGIVHLAFERPVTEWLKRRGNPAPRTTGMNPAAGSASAARAMAAGQPGER